MLSTPGHKKMEDTMLRLFSPGTYSLMVFACLWIQAAWDFLFTWILSNFHAKNCLNPAQKMVSILVNHCSTSNQVGSSPSTLVCLYILKSKLSENSKGDKSIRNPSNKDFGIQYSNPNQEPKTVLDYLTRARQIRKKRPLALDFPFSSSFSTLSTQTKAQKQKLF